MRLYLTGRRKRKDATDELKRLGKLLSAQQTCVAQLAMERENLHARLDALAALASSLKALLHVTEPLRALGDDGASGAALAAWHSELQALEAQLDGRSSFNEAGPGDPGASGDAGLSLPGWARLVEDIISRHGPEGAMERYGAYTVQQLAEGAKQFTLEASVLLFRVRANAHDAAAASDRLRASLDSMLATCVLVMVAKPSVIVELNTIQLDTMGQILETRDSLFWAFMVKEMHLSKRQFLAVSFLLDTYQSHVAALMMRREELMRRQEECATDTDEQWELLADVNTCQTMFVWSVLGTSSAIYSQLLTPAQTAGAMVAAYPLVPSLLAIREGLKSQPPQSLEESPERSPEVAPEVSPEGTQQEQPDPPERSPQQDEVALEEEARGTGGSRRERD